MSTRLFITLPVADVPKARAFYEALGFPADPQMSDETTACIVISETIAVMLGSHEKFRQLSPKPMSNAHTHAQLLLALTCESKERVDDLVARAVAAGGSTTGQPNDYGFMYDHDFTDLDGHGWGLVYMRGAPAGAESGTGTS